eukprot:521293-Prymnesium_polylepis.1
MFVHHAWRSWTGPREAGGTTAGVMVRHEAERDTVEVPSAKRVTATGRIERTLKECEAGGAVAASPSGG